MTGIFKANNSYNNILLLFYGLLLKLPLFLHPKVPQPQQIDGFLYKALLDWLQPIGKGFPVVYSLLSFIVDHTQIKRLLMINGEDKTVHSINKEVISK